MMKSFVQAVMHMAKTLVQAVMHMIKAQVHVTVNFVKIMVKVVVMGHIHARGSSVGICHGAQAENSSDYERGGVFHRIEWCVFAPCIEARLRRGCGSRQGPRLVVDGQGGRGGVGEPRVTKNSPW